MNHHLLRNWAGFCGVNLTCSSTIVVMIIHQLEKKSETWRCQSKCRFVTSRGRRVLACEGIVVATMWGIHTRKLGLAFAVSNILLTVVETIFHRLRGKKYKPQSRQSKCPFCDVSCETRSGLWGSCQQCEEFIRKNIIYLLQEKRNDARVATWLYCRRDNVGYIKRADQRPALFWVLKGADVAFNMAARGATFRNGVRKQGSDSRTHTGIHLVFVTRLEELGSCTNLLVVWWVVIGAEGTPYPHVTSADVGRSGWIYNSFSNTGASVAGWYE